MMFWYGAAWPWWGVALMWLGVVAFWGGVIWAFYFLVSSLTRPPSPAPPAVDARRILDERLARGEIDAEQYRTLRELIWASRPATAPPAWTQ
jgi:putative membrane protein